MNLFQLVLKQMRQRALSTWLTMLSVLLGVALAVGTLLIERESAALFVQSDYGYDVIVGAKASDLQLVLNTVYHLDKSPGNIPWTFYQTLRTDPRFEPLVKAVVPYVVGDSVEGQRAVGTLPELFGFDNQTGKPLEGYNERGELLPAYQSPLVDPADRDPAKPVAADVIGYRAGKKYELASGRMFHPRRFEAVVGADIPRLLKLNIGGTFRITHGLPAANETPDVHDERWTIVGVLKPTHTANDRVLFVPVISYFAIGSHKEGLEAQKAIHAGADVYAGTRPATSPADAGHDQPDADHDDHADQAGHDAANPGGPDAHDADADADHDAPDAAKPGGPDAHAAHDAGADHDAPAGGHHHHHKAFTLTPDGDIQLDLPESAWQASALLVKTRGGGGTAQQLIYLVRNGDIATAVAPGQVMRGFFETFLAPGAQLLLLVSILVTIVAAVGILVSIYNSVSARLREIAILRALGATRYRVLAIICLEATFVGFMGAVLGLILGHGVAAGVSAYFQRTLGQGIDWITVGPSEWMYVAGVTIIALLAGLAPAWKAYRTPVATHLVGG